MSNTTMDSGKLQGKKILLGVSGSIAAYKSAVLARLLMKSGAIVKVVMTPDAAHFITPLTFSTLTGQQVVSGLVSDSQWNNHVELGLWADLMLIVPATANTLAKMSTGICDNLLLAVYLSAKCPVMVAPAMDLDMWKHPSTQRNISVIEEYGNKIIPVGNGLLASGLVGDGRVAEPEEIVQFVHEFFQPKNTALLHKQILVTAGPTYENLDPVRFIGNRSSGKMGIAITEELLNRGAKVYLVLGPTHETINNHPNLTITKVNSAQEMLEASLKAYPQTNGAIFTAAVSDFTPEIYYDQKFKKKEGEDSWNIALKKTADIAKELGMIKSNNQVNVGFALETQDENENAKRKLKSKNFDFIVLNSLNDSGAGFGTDTNKITIFNTKGEKKSFELKSKQDVAKDIINELENYF